MWSWKVLVETAVEHTRRVLHIAKRQATLVHQPRTQHPCHKLNKWRSEGGGVVPVEGECGGVVSRGGGVGAAGLWSHLGPVTSRLVNSLVRKVSAPLWAEARRRTTQRLVFGESAPYFALVGVSLAANQQGFVTKEDELEALCGNIREAISRAGWIHNPEYWESQRYVHDEEAAQETEEQHVFGLQDFTLGPAIDKGCSAVVYSAKWNIDDSTECSADCPPPKKPRSESPSPVQDLREEDLYSRSSDENGQLYIPTSVESVEHMDDEGSQSSDDAAAPNARSDLVGKARRVKFKLKKKETGSRLKRPAAGQNTQQEATATFSAESSESGEGMDAASVDNYPLAIKMMFNYEAASNAPAILRAMYKEMLPARSLQLDDSQLQWQQQFCSTHKQLPQHHNIVDMPCVFVDRIPFLEGSMMLYPDALPSRINPNGAGRNMSLFCVMKRYDTSMKEYLRQYNIPEHTSLLLLTQLLEAILHINNHNIAHRDLKSDNILLSLAEGWQYPHLVLTDFGCSVVSDDGSLVIPFPSYESDPRQGNPAHMAPEVKAAVPGLLRSVNYSLADLWAVGALAYEIYGQENPYCPTQPSSSGGNGSKQKYLDSYTYRDSQLPRLPKTVPASIRRLIQDLLRRNPRNRPSVKVAATLCQLILWAPKKWLCRHSLTLPSHTEIMQWLLCLTTKVLCEARLSGSQYKRQTSREQQRRMEDMAGAGSDRQGGQLEYELVSTFLARVHYVDIIQAIKWNRAF